MRSVFTYGYLGRLFVLNRNFLGELGMDLFGVFSAFGLSASAGLNAYIPLLSIALLAKYHRSD
jgi:hypothetical protein